MACPSCTAIISETDKICPYCGRTVLILGDIKKKPFLCNRATIEQCIDILEEANEKEPSEVIDYLRAYIEYDYFERKHLNRNPGYSYFLKKSYDSGITKEKIEKLEKEFNYTMRIGGN